MTRSKMVLVPETAVRDLKTIPLATCGTCWHTLPFHNPGREPDTHRFMCCRGGESPVGGRHVPSHFCCNQWEPKDEPKRDTRFLRGPHGKPYVCEKCGERGERFEGCHMAECDAEARQ